MAVYLGRLTLPSSSDLFLQPTELTETQRDTWGHCHREAHSKGNQGWLPHIHSPEQTRESCDVSHRSQTQDLQLHLTSPLPNQKVPRTDQTYLWRFSDQTTFNLLISFPFGCHCLGASRVLSRDWSGRIFRVLEHLMMCTC